MLSSVFVPLYGVILGRMAGLSFASPSTTSAAATPVNWTAAAIWIAGIVLYHALGKFAPYFGSALPTLAFTLVLAWLTRPKAN